MTLAELRTRVLAAVPEAYYTPLEATAALNQGQRIFALLSLCLEDLWETTLAESTGWVVPAPSGWMIPLRAEFNGVKLDVETLGSLTALNPYWRNAIDVPRHYIPVGPQLIGIHPMSLTGGPLKIQYAREPDVLLLDSAVPNIREVYHESLIDYAVARLRVKEGGDELMGEIERLKRFLEAAKSEATITLQRSLSLRYDVTPSENWWTLMEGKQWLTQPKS